MNITIDDFAPLSPLVKGYELDPAKHYFIICDGKKFEYKLAEALFKNIRENHPNLSIHIINTEAPKAIEVRETTLADQLDVVLKKWERISDFDLSNGMDVVELITDLQPLLNRAIKALRGDHAS
jgi:hypothetical protein